LQDTEEQVMMRIGTDRSDAMALDRRRLLALNLASALGALAAAALLDAQSAANAGWRSPAPWCAALGGYIGGFDCSYRTFDQCMATARGLGGYCTPNPSALYAPPARPRPRARR
jgi:hypothetical protein